MSLISMSQPTPTSTLFPYTTLFRSLCDCHPTVSQSPMTNSVNKIRKCAIFDCKKVGQTNQRKLGTKFWPHFPYWLSRIASTRSEEHTSELQSRGQLVCRLLLEKK